MNKNNNNNKRESSERKNPPQTKKYTSNSWRSDSNKFQWGCFKNLSWINPNPSKSSHPTKGVFASLERVRVFVMNEMKDLKIKIDDVKRKMLEIQTKKRSTKKDVPLPQVSPFGSPLPDSLSPTWLSPSHIIVGQRIDTQSQSSFSSSSSSAWACSEEVERAAKKLENLDRVAKRKRDEVKSIPIGMLGWIDQKDKQEKGKDKNGKKKKDNWLKKEAKKQRTWHKKILSFEDDIYDALKSSDSK